MPSEVQPSAPAQGSLAARVLADKDLVLRRFMEQARSRLPAAAAQDDRGLRDTLPDVIDTIALALASATPDEVLNDREHIAREHGRERAGQEEYDLAQVIDEYLIFRQVLFEVFEDGGVQVEARDRDVVLDAVQLFVRSSASEFAARAAGIHAQDVVSLRDARTRLEKQLNQSEERFRLLVEGVNDYAIFTIDPDGFVTSWNAGAQRMKGYKAAEIIGQHYSVLYSEDGKVRGEPESHLRTATREGRFRGEGTRRRKNGEIFDADVLITAMYDDGKVLGFSKVVQDLTERNALMQERDLSRLDAERLAIEAEYRERFVSMLTHDLRTPLSAALTAAELIDGRPDDPAKVRTWAQRISEAVKRTDRMIRDLLDATRLRAGEPLHLDIAPCDAGKIAEEVTAERAARDGPRFHVSVSGDVHGMWSCDGLRRVLDNLVSNAVKYGDAGTPITTRVHRIDDRVLISVHNFGAIIPPDEQSKLFTLFHRAPSAIGKSGWGLGLSLVRGLIEAHGGMVKVESYPKTGTTFTVDLPVDARTGDHVKGAGEVETR